MAGHYRFTESEVEAAALEWLDALGYEIHGGDEIAPGEPGAERSGFSEVLLLGRLSAAARKLNPHLPQEGIEEAVRKVARIDAPTTVAANRRFHAMLRDGVEVEVRRPDGSVGGDAPGFSITTPRGTTTGSR